MSGIGWQAFAIQFAALAVSAALYFLAEPNPILAFAAGASTMGCVVVVTIERAQRGRQ